MAPPPWSWMQSPTELLEMTDDELAAFEAHISATCTENSKNWRVANFRQCISVEFKGSKYFIKYDNPSSIWPEFSTQSYICDYAMRHGDGPHVPQTLHYFEDSRCFYGYLVMEHIEFTHPSLITDSDLAERTAKALQWLSEVPPPPCSEDLLGPVGGGRIRHRFFKDNEAPLEFSSVDALERYMNEARRRTCRSAANPAKPMVIIDDPLIFTQSDMHISNFGVDDRGKTVLFDFGQIGRLPLTFAKYTIGSGTGDGFASRVANILCWPENPNMYTMARVSSCLVMAANPQFGLDKDGRPVSKVKT